MNIKFKYLLWKIEKTISALEHNKKFVKNDTIKLSDYDSRINLLKDIITDIHFVIESDNIFLKNVLESYKKPKIKKW